MTASLRWIGASLLACAVALTGPGVRPASACHSEDEEAAEAAEEAAEAAAEAQEEAAEAAAEAAEAEAEAAQEAAEAAQEAAEADAEAAQEAAEAAEEADEADRAIPASRVRTAHCGSCDHDDDDDDDVEVQVEAEVELDSDRIDRLLEQVNRLLESQLDHLLDRLGDLQSGGAAVWMEVDLD